MKRSGLPKYVTRFQDRHDIWWFRARRPRYPTHYFVAAPGTEEFAAEYQRWLAGRPPVGPPASRTLPGSVSALIARVYASAAWQVELAPSTQAPYRGIL